MKDHRFESVKSILIKMFEKKIIGKSLGHKQLNIFNKNIQKTKKC